MGKLDKIKEVQAAMIEEGLESLECIKKSLTEMESIELSVLDTDTEDDLVDSEVVLFYPTTRSIDRADEIASALYHSMCLMSDDPNTTLIAVGKLMALVISDMMPNAKVGDDVDERAAVAMMITAIGLNAVRQNEQEAEELGEQLFGEHLDRVAKMVIDEDEDPEEEDEEDAELDDPDDQDADSSEDEITDIIAEKLGGDKETAKKIVEGEPEKDTKH